MTQHAFQSEVAQLLHLVVHSLYSDREVFLRELLANAADACDKLRVSALTEHGLAGGAEAGIAIAIDKAARTLSVTDTGIGMTEAEAIANLGTIARSGTKAFVQQLAAEQQKSANLIGQFGVGFYAAFMVADRVVVETRSARAGADDACRWESRGDGTFTTERMVRAERGTTVTLHLKEDAAEFLEPWRIRALVKRHSDYLATPVRMAMAEGKDPEQLNAGTPLWTRPKDQITAEQVAEFARGLHLFEAPASHLHAQVEGTLAFTALILFPDERPLDLFDRDRQGLGLYVRRVFVMDDCRDLLPEWLRFVRGVVDSDDLPLNVSREMLQGSDVVGKLRRQLTKRIVDHLAHLAHSADPAEQAAFARIEAAFGTIYREALAGDAEYRDRVARIVRYASTWTVAAPAEGETRPATTFLEDYVKRQGDSDKAIYVVTAPSLDAAKASPLVEGYVARGKEVLFLTDPVDEWVAAHLGSFDGRPVVNIALGEADLGDAKAKQELDARSSELKPFLDFCRAHGGVADVRLSQRLAGSPACVVGEATGLTPQMEALLRRSGQPVPEQRRILELNPGHPLVARLAAMSSDPAQAELAKEHLGVLRDTAILAAGGQVADGPGLARRVQALLAG